MSLFLGRQDCVESLRRDLIDLQGTILDVFSKTGPVRCASWKFPDKLSCNLDLVSLLEQYDFADGDDEFNQHSHSVLLELVIDRLLLLLQSFNVYAEQLRGQRRDLTQQKGCVSVGLVVRQYWSNLVQLVHLKGTCTDIRNNSKTRIIASEEKTTASSVTSSRTDLGTPCPSLSSSSSSLSFVPQPRVAFPSPCPDPAGPRCPSYISISSDTRSVSCQTVESSLVPCDACDGVQSALRQTGDALVDLCRSEGLPSSLQPLLMAVEETLELGHLTAGDVAQWAREQRRDMGRLGKHLQEVRGTVEPLRDGLAAAQRQREGFKSQLERTQKELRQETETHCTRMRQLENTLQESHRALKETERRFQEEREQFKKGTLSLEESTSRLEKELALQHETLHALESENIDLQKKVDTLRVEEEARRKLEERTEMLKTQISQIQLLLDKECAKYKSVCRQLESMQVKQKVMLERVDALDKECEDLHRQLSESEEMQANLQLDLKNISEQKEHLQAQLSRQQELCSEFQKEKLKLESRESELQTTVSQLKLEMKDLTQRQRLLVAFPELHPLPQAQPQSTGDLLLDMEQQLQANNIRIRILQQENSTLHNSLVKLREQGQHDISKDISPEQKRNHSLTEEQQDDTSQTQCSSLQDCSAVQLKHGVRRMGAGRRESDPGSIGPWDRVSTANSSLCSRASPPSSSSSSSVVHHQTLHLNLGTSAAKTYGRARQASLARSRGLKQWKK